MSFIKGLTHFVLKSPDAYIPYPSCPSHTEESCASSTFCFLSLSPPSLARSHPTSEVVATLWCPFPKSRQAASAGNGHWSVSIPSGFPQATEWPNQCRRWRRYWRWQLSGRDVAGAVLHCATLLGRQSMRESLFEGNRLSRVAAVDWVVVMVVATVLG